MPNMYPWTAPPLIVSAPMRMIALAELAVSVSKAGGLGFIGSGNDQSNLESLLREAKKLCEATPALDTATLPIGVGFLNWGADLEEAARCLAIYQPCAVWFFAPRDIENLNLWSSRCKQATNGATQIWVQVGGVEEAKAVTKAISPDVLVVQGGDGGGHGLNASASIIALVPEVIDALMVLRQNGEIADMPKIIAAGGISDGRAVAASLALGADGVCLGTRFLAAHEAVLATGYRNEVLRTADGGQTTIRSSVYDRLRGTTDWPSTYGGRGIINQSYHDAMQGMSWEENSRKYQEAVETADTSRLTAYAGTGVGLVKKLQSAGDIVEELRSECKSVLARTKV